MTPTEPTIKNRLERCVCGHIKKSHITLNRINMHQKERLSSCSSYECECRFYRMSEAWKNPPRKPTTRQAAKKPEAHPRTVLGKCGICGGNQYHQEDGIRFVCSGCGAPVMSRHEMAQFNKIMRKMQGEDSAVATNKKAISAMSPSTAAPSNPKVKSPPSKAPPDTTLVSEKRITCNTPVSGKVRSIVSTAQAARVLLDSPEAMEEFGFDSKKFGRILRRIIEKEGKP